MKNAFSCISVRVAFMALFRAREREEFEHFLVHPRRPRPRSQGSLLPAPRSERERAGRREPWERGCGDPGAVGRVGRRGGTKVFITGERAPGYRLSPNRFQKFKRMPAPDWAQKILCIIVPNRRTHLNEFFSCVRT